MNFKIELFEFPVYLVRSIRITNGLETKEDGDCVSRIYYNINLENVDSPDYLWTFVVAASNISVEEGVVVGSLVRVTEFETEFGTKKHVFSLVTPIEALMRRKRLQK